MPGPTCRCKSRARWAQASQLGASQASQLDGYQLPPSQLSYAIPGLTDRARNGQGDARRGGMGGTDGAPDAAGLGFGFGGVATNAPATQLSGFQQACLH